MSGNELETTDQNGKRRLVDTSDDKTPPARKQRFDSHGVSFWTDIRTKIGQKKQLSNEDYTVAWICALPLELEASRLMLDEEHEQVRVDPSDHNSYILGSIGSQNVVMTCLPAGIYGSTTATVAAKDLKASFPNTASFPLLVGIGGGVPNANDVRLGDVVVGTPASDLPAIRPYGLGKIGLNGRLESRGTLNRPASAPLASISILKTKEQQLGSRVQEHVSAASHKSDDDRFTYPGAVLDELHQPECEHFHDDSICSVCGPPTLVERGTRTSLDPKIHFGSIGSGGQVIKHARTRDNLAKEYRVICFEMEAIGLMDYLQCLVIRGISDYCDSFKNDIFQPWAALTAAAFAKEIVLTQPPRKLKPKAGKVKLNDEEREEQRKLIIQNLDFIEADNRHDSIKTAHKRTCHWLLRQQQYLDWRSFKEGAEEYGMLWIKGKAGTGKSTIMKFLLQSIQKSKSRTDIVINFFFNARGELLERSLHGFYRSLIVQLLAQLPDLHYLLDSMKLPASGQDWKLDSLQRLLGRILREAPDRHIICLVDALDECPEAEVRNMVEDFVDCISSSTNSGKLHILFSSRHYPNISIDIGQQFVLEKQNGHTEDLTEYVQAELKIGNNVKVKKLKEDIFNKANGIFLWVVLVVRILKQDYDHGRRVADMAQRLKDIPTALNELFRDILLRDSDRFAELKSCIRWILYSERPLKREELYFAMAAGNEDMDIEPWDQEEDGLSEMDKFILDRSKGLAELTRGKQPVVQFIHESVREFLLRPVVLTELWNGDLDMTAVNCQLALRTSCYRLITSEFMYNKLNLPEKLAAAKDEKTIVLKEKIHATFPFLDYAVTFVLHHADKAKHLGVDQFRFLIQFDRTRWVEIHNALQKHSTRRLKDTSVDIVQYMQSRDLNGLAGDWLGISPLSPSGLEMCLQKCSKLGDNEFCKLLLHHYNVSRDPSRRELYLARLDTLADFIVSQHAHYRGQNSYNDLSSLPRWTSSWCLQKNEHDLSALALCAAFLKHDLAIEALLDIGLISEIDLIKVHGQKLLTRVCEVPTKFKTEDDGLTDIFALGDSAVYIKEEARAKKCIELLLARGADFKGMEFITNAFRWPRLDFAFFLMKCGLKAPDLGHIAEQGYHDPSLMGQLIQDLLLAEPSMEQQDARGNALLHRSCWSFLSRMLLEKGAPVNALNKAGNTPLHEAVTRKRPNAQLLRTLLHYGANVDAKSRKGLTPLKLVIRYADDRQLPIYAQILVDHGADLAQLSKPSYRNAKTAVELSYITKVESMKRTEPCCKPDELESTSIPMASPESSRLINKDEVLEWTSSNDSFDEDQTSQYDLEEEVVVRRLFEGRIA